MDSTKEVTFERTLDASRESVWQAWTYPAKLKAWWGPQETLIPECEVDLRVGGKFYIVMEAGEGMGSYKGTRWPMQAEFTEVVPNSKLAYSAKAWTEGMETETEIETISELVLTEQDGKTKLNLKSAIL